MKGKSIYINGLSKTESNSLWKWKGINFQREKHENKLYEFFKESGRQIESSILGPGIGAGIGCGVGLGIGIAGGAGFDGSPWNHLKMVLGVGFGCGIGVGFGYGEGIIGGGFSYESLKSHVFTSKSKSKSK
ncbi:glycine-rich protein 23-like [Forsythia ovata]|uniref:Glycine-rich protein 23-like n=1 Tax=Forsythia ovata TaxID=205694 RepID=A0ABD1WQ05_9LAMI